MASPFLPEISIPLCSVEENRRLTFPVVGQRQLDIFAFGFCEEVGFEETLLELVAFFAVVVFLMGVVFTVLALRGVDFVELREADEAGFFLRYNFCPG